MLDWYDTCGDDKLNPAKLAVAYKEGKLKLSSDCLYSNLTRSYKSLIWYWRHFCYQGACNSVFLRLSVQKALIFTLVQRSCWVEYSFVSNSVKCLVTVHILLMEWTMLSFHLRLVVLLYRIHLNKFARVKKVKNVRKWLHSLCLWWTMIIFISVCATISHGYDSTYQCIRMWMSMAMTRADIQIWQW